MTGVQTCALPICWEKLSKKAHLAAIWLVAIGSNLSALWILIANSFMQSPVGFTVENGRAVMNDFGALVFNPYVWLQFPHTVLSGFTTAAFFVMGISVYHLLRRKEEGVFSRSFRLASIFGAVSILLVIFVGHSQAQRMVQVQPMKMAAAEALWESADPAPFSVFSVMDQAGGRNVVDIRIPRVLSLLSYNRLDGEVRGILDLQAEYEAKYGPGYYVPSVFMAYWTFRVMVGAGFLMFFLAAYALYWVMRNRPLGQVKFLGVFGAAMALPYLANTAGWLLTEMGRQPWVVYGYMKTADAVSPTLTAGMVLTSLIGFTLVYAVLMAADVYLLAKYAKAGPAPEVKKQHPVKEEAYWE